MIYISSPPTFDPFVVDLLLGLFNGATVLMVSNAIRLSTMQLLSSFETNSVTIVQITPSLFRRFSLDSIQNRLLSSPSALRCLILGGEPFPSMDEVALWFKGNDEPKTRFFNIYGITEVSCWSTIYELTSLDIHCKHLIPIGLPLDQHTTLTVLDSSNKEIVDNGIGELFIASKVRNCVISENGRTDSCGATTIATGDLVEIRSGTIFYRTRANNMVKIFGRKVNLSKVENAAKLHCSVSDACCVYDQNGNSLNLFVQSGNAQTCTKKEMLQGLRQRLLEQEVPNEICFVDEFPLSCHGKVSKSKLLEMIKKPSRRCHRDYFVAKLEENLSSFDVETTLKLSFLAAGGSSVLALQIIGELETKFNFVDPELITMLLNHDVSIERIVLRLQDHSPDIHFTSRNTSVTASSLRCSWSHDLKKCIDASPTICSIGNDNIVSVGSHSHELINVDLSSGRLLSKLVLPHRIECQIVQYNTYGIVGCYDGFVYCFDVRTGTEKWKFNSHGMVKSKVCVVESFVVFGNYNSESNLWCLRAEDGAFVWNKKIGEKSIYAGIVRTINNQLIVTTLDGVCAIVDPFAGESLWETKFQSPIFSTPMTTGKTLFVAEVFGIVHCIDWNFGKTLSSYKADGNIYSSIELISERSICFGCYDKSVYCLSFDTDVPLFQILWKVETSGQIFASPKTFTFNSMQLLLVCSTNGSVCMLDSNGGILKRFQIDGEIFSTPSVANDKVIIASRNNLLYGFDVKQILSTVDE